MWILKKKKKCIWELHSSTKYLGSLGAALLVGEYPVQPLPWCKVPGPSQLYQLLDR